MDNNDIVNGSVEGVITADKIAEEITTIFQFEIIFSVVIIPREPRMIVILAIEKLLQY